MISTLRKDWVNASRDFNPTHWHMSLMAGDPVSLLWRAELTLSNQASNLVVSWKLQNPSAPRLLTHTQSLLHHIRVYKEFQESITKCQNNHQNVPRSSTRHPSRPFTAGRVTSARTRSRSTSNTDRIRKN